MIKIFKNLLLFIATICILAGCSKIYVYTPNYIIIKKPIPLEIIRTEDRLSKIHQMKKIIDYNFATIGSALRLQGKEIYLIKEKDLLQEYKTIPLLKTNSQIYNNYNNFFPNTIGYRYPTSVHLLNTYQEVSIVKASKYIYKYHLAQIGAAISLSLDGKYFNLIPRDVIQRDYYEPIELRKYLRNN